MQYVAWFYCKGGEEPVKREIKSAGKEIDWKWCRMLYAIFLKIIFLLIRYVYLFTNLDFISE